MPCPYKRIRHSLINCVSSDLAKTIEAKLRVSQFLAVALLGSCTAKLDKLLDIKYII